MQTTNLFNWYIVAAFFYLPICSCYVSNAGNWNSSTLQVVRPSLMPGLLRTVGHNKDHPKPIKVIKDNWLLHGFTCHLLYHWLYCFNVWSKLKIAISDSCKKIAFLTKSSNRLYFLPDLVSYLIFFWREISYNKLNYVGDVCLTSEGSFCFNYKWHLLVSTTLLSPSIKLCDHLVTIMHISVVATVLV